MSQEFKNLISYLDRLQSRYFKTFQAFFVYKTLTDLKAPNIVGDKNARDNVNITNNFKIFFVSSEEALRVYFLLELAKMFDISNQSLHIIKIITYTKNQNENEKLTVDNFKESNQDRDFLEELIEDYKGISKEDIKKIEEILEKNKDVLCRLKTYRNKYLAHDDINKKEILIKDNEIIGLFKILGEIINLVSYKLNNSTWARDYVENNSKESSTEMIFDHLKKFKSYQLKKKEELIKNMKLTHKTKE